MITAPVVTTYYRDMQPRRLLRGKRHVTYAVKMTALRLLRFVPPFLKKGRGFARNDEVGLGQSHPTRKATRWDRPYNTIPYRIST